MCCGIPINTEGGKKRRIFGTVVVFAVLKDQGHHAICGEVCSCEVDFSLVM